MNDQRVELILYATPAGPLAEQIDRYVRDTNERFGANTAHRYPPHCSLTGFFHDVRLAVPDYVAALDAALLDVGAPPRPMVAIEHLHVDGDWHGLELRGPWLLALTAAFVRRASRFAAEELRPKTWLHLSLAYGFDPIHTAALVSASTTIDVGAEVRWEVAVWERDGDVWRRH